MQISKSIKLSYMLFKYLIQNIYYNQGGKGMNNFINVTSEIGKLNKLMLHRPGNEVENLVPDYLERLLFDDIPYLKVAQEEHDRFAEVLRENGAEVLYLEDLAAEVLEDKKLKMNS